MKKDSFLNFSVLTELAKVRITLAVTITTSAGYVLKNQGFSVDMLIPAFGLFLTACGSAVINQIQERKHDAQMERTKNRPLPSGKVSLGFAVIYATVLTLSGLIILWVNSGLIPMVLALTALIWYNLIYTPLKKITAFAVVPGSVIGAIPPAVGWSAAGGSLADPSIWYFCFFLFIWQVPHFWLLLMKYGEQYLKAGFPSLTQVYNDSQLKRITFIWAFAMAISGMLLVFTGLFTGLFTKISLFLFSLIIIIFFAGLILKNSRPQKFGRYFMLINLYMLAVVALMMLDVSLHQV